jgi:hypothetical protein
VLTASQAPQASVFTEQSHHPTHHQNCSLKTEDTPTEETRQLKANTYSLFCTCFVVPKKRNSFFILDNYTDLVRRKENGKVCF